MMTNRFALPLHVQVVWDGDENLSHETVTAPVSNKDGEVKCYMLYDQQGHWVAGDWADNSENHYHALADLRDKVNALSGIPNEWLPEVRKAVLSEKLYNMLSVWYDDAEMSTAFTLRAGILFEQHYGQIPDSDKLLKMAQKLHSRGADFGPELTALIGAME